MSASSQGGETGGPLPDDFDASGPAHQESGIFGLPCEPSSSAVVLLPVPWEATVSYCGGTGRGPATIVRASQQVELYDAELGRPYEAGIALLEPHAEVARVSERTARCVRELRGMTGDPEGAEVAAARREIDAACGWLNDVVRAEVARWIGEGKLVGVLGGEHAVSFGAIAAHAERWGPLGVLHIDAHADLRVAYEGLRYSHASVMERVLSELPQVAKLVSVGLRDMCEPEHEAIRANPARVHALLDGELAARLLDGEPFTRIAREVVEALPPSVYVSFDIDGLDPSLCPHTGTPVPGGLSFHQALVLLRAVVQSGRCIVGFDLCEVAPGPGGDEWDGNVGARLTYQLIGLALRSAPRA